MKRLVLVAVVAMALAAAQTAHASSIQMKIFDGSTTVTILDNGVGDANPGTTGVIQRSGVFGGLGWTFDATGTNLGTGHLELNIITSAAPTSGSLTIWLTQLGDLGGFPSGFWMDFDGTITNGTVAYSAADCPNNMAFHMPPQGVSVTIGDLGPFGPGAFSGSTQGPGSVAVPVAAGYSITQRMVITANGALTYSGDAEVQPVPDPGSSLLLLGMGLVGLTAWRKRLG